MLHVQPTTPWLSLPKDLRRMIKKYARVMEKKDVETLQTEIKDLDRQIESFKVVGHGSLDQFKELVEKKGSAVIKLEKQHGIPSIEFPTRQHHFRVSSHKGQRAKINKKIMKVSNIKGSGVPKKKKKTVVINISD